MSIDLHCPSCGKMISAPDDAGGKRGKCPYCATSMYIPMPPAPDEEEIGISPIDEEAEARRARALLRESLAAVRESAGAAGETVEETGPTQVPDIGAEVEQYITAMRDSHLEVAEQACARLLRVKVRAQNHVQAMLMDEMLTPMAGVPLPLMKGLLQKLLRELS